MGLAQALFNYKCMHAGILALLKYIIRKSLWLQLLNLSLHIAWMKTTSQKNCAKLWIPYGYSKFVVCIDQLKVLIISCLFHSYNLDWYLLISYAEYYLMYIINLCMNYEEYINFFYYLVDISASVFSYSHAVQYHTILLGYYCMGVIIAWAGATQYPSNYDVL